MKKSILASSIVHILILSIVLVALVFIDNPIDNNQTIAGKWVIRWVFSITAVVLATLRYRNKYSNGFISYGKAFLVGFTVISIAYGLRGISIGIDLSNNPEILTEMHQLAEEKMYEDSPNMSEEEEEMAFSMLSTFTSPVSMALLSILRGLFWAAILSLVTAAIFKKTAGNIDDEDPIDIES